MRKIKTAHTKKKIKKKKKEFRGSLANSAKRYKN